MVRTSRSDPLRDGKRFWSGSWSRHGLRPRVKRLQVNGACGGAPEVRGHVTQGTLSLKSVVSHARARAARTMRRPWSVRLWCRAPRSTHAVVCAAEEGHAGVGVEPAQPRAQVPAGRSQRSTAAYVGGERVDRRGDVRRADRTRPRRGRASRPWGLQPRGSSPIERARTRTVGVARGVRWGPTVRAVRAQVREDATRASSGSCGEAQGVSRAVEGVGVLRRVGIGAVDQHARDNERPQVQT